MTRSAQVSFLAPEFDEFLFAQIGEDGNGMLLSVLSALARLDLDPWQEAAKLARLPKTTATERLASLLRTPCGELPADPEPETLAAGLIALLPQLSRISIGSPEPVSRAAGASAYLQATTCVVVAAIFTVLALGIEFTMASHAAVHPGNDNAVVVRTTHVQKQPPTAIDNQSSWQQEMR